MKPGTVHLVLTYYKKLLLKVTKMRHTFSARLGETLLINTQPQLRQSIY